MNDYNKFLKKNVVTNFNKDYLNEYFLDDSLLFLKKYKEINNLIFNLGGATIDNGLFRFHTFGSSFFWTEIVTSYFKKYNGKLYCFAFDWLGRNYAKDLQKKIIYRIDSATGEIFSIDNLDINIFLNEDLVEYRDDTLNTDFFNLLVSKNNPLKFNDCFNFITPLFLGGKDVIENYEVLDMEVSWEIDYQLYCKIHKLPDEKLINKVSIKEKRG